MDNTLFSLLFGLNKQIPFLSEFMIFGSEYVIYLTLFLMFILAFRGNIKERKALLITIISLPIAVLLIKFIHIFIVEQRPFIQYSFIPLVSEKPDLSFPSRHATIIAVIAFSYLYYKSKWTALFLILMSWVGISRVFVGVHFPIDIIGGFSTGALSVFIVTLIKNALKRRLVIK